MELGECEYGSDLIIDSSIWDGMAELVVVDATWDDNFWAIDELQGPISSLREE